MQGFFTEKGLIHQTTCPHTPEQNGVAERKNRYILEITRALLIDSKIPRSFWPEAIATSVYLLNRLPTKILNFKTPLEILSTLSSVPSSLTLEPRIFGCIAFVHIPKNDRTKFSPCAIKCVFLGYGKNQKGYRCYDPKTRTMYTTMNCDFIEGEYYYTQPSSQGETQHSDSLGWLPIETQPNLGTNTVQGENPPNPSHPPSVETNPPVTDVGPSEPVNSATEPPISNVQNVEPSDTTDPSTPVLDPEVNNSDIDITPQNLLSGINDDRTEENEIESVGVDGDTGQYELPRRSTRGIPPRRYSPDWKG